MGPFLGPSVMSDYVDVVREMLSLAQEEGDSPQARELGGFVIREDGALRLIQLDNIHSKPTDRFAIDADAQLDVFSKYDVVAMWHTHPNEDCHPSPADLIIIEAMDLPCHIVSWPQGGHTYTEPSGYEAPLEGRPFVHGILDCYSVIRDYYKREFGIALKDYEREDGWWERDEDLYVQHFQDNGFYDIGQDAVPDVGDVILMKVGGKEVKNTNHGAVYLGNEMMIHHLYGKLSAKAVYGGYWRTHTTHILKHESRAPCNSKKPALSLEAP